MKISEFQEISKRTMPKMRQGKNKMRYTKWDKCNYGMGISGEAGEVTDLIKKHIHHKHPLDIDELKKELGDVLHYVYGIATMFGISMDEVHTLNILKLNERYPNGYSDTDSLKRVDTIYDKNTIVNTPENFDIMSMYPQIMKEPVKAGKLQMSSMYGKFGKGIER